MRIPLLLAAVAFGVSLWTLPVWWCQRGAGLWYEGNVSRQSKLAQTVSEQIQRGLSTGDYHTQSVRFDGEWLFGSYLMAGIGLCQIVQQDPDSLERWKPDIEKCIRELLSPAVRDFDRRAWNRDPLESLSEDEGHAAYLGYLNFLLSLYRQIHPRNEFASLNDLLTESLRRRTLSSANGFVATYPGEWYPVDNCPILAGNFPGARPGGPILIPDRSFLGLDSAPRGSGWPGPELIKMKTFLPGFLPVPYWPGLPPRAGTVGGF